MVYSNRPTLFLKKHQLFQKDYENEYFEFINSEGRTKNVMTIARIQPFCSKYDINIGCYKLGKKTNFSYYNK